MDIKYEAMVAKISHSLLILLYQAAPRLKVFYTSMPQLVSVKGFHIWDVTRQREKGWAQSAEKLLDERKLCPMGISI